MKRSIALQTAAGVFVLFCCCVLGLAQDVHYNFVPGTDLSKYKTYRWVPVEGGAHPEDSTHGIESVYALKKIIKRCKLCSD